MAVVPVHKVDHKNLQWTLKEPHHKHVHKEVAGQSWHPKRNPVQCQSHYEPVIIRKVYYVHRLYHNKSLAFKVVSRISEIYLIFITSKNVLNGVIFSSEHVTSCWHSTAEGN